MPILKGRVRIPFFPPNFYHLESAPSPSLSGWESQCTFCFLTILLLPDQSLLNIGLPKTVHWGYFYYNKPNIFKFISIQLTASNMLPLGCRGIVSRWCPERRCITRAQWGIFIVLIIYLKASVQVLTSQRQCSVCFPQLRTVIPILQKQKSSHRW